MTNRERVSSTDSSARVGRCAMSMRDSSFRQGTRYLIPQQTPSAYRTPKVQPSRRERLRPHALPAGRGPAGLLRVELHDELLLHVDHDLLTGRQLVHQDAAALGKDLQPG